MGRPTKARSPEEQYKLEKKRFTQRMRPKPVLAEQIKRREAREQARKEKLQLEGKKKVYTEDLI